MTRLSARWRPLAFVALAATLLLSSAGLAAASPFSQATPVNAAPASGTPAVDDGTVYAFATVGSMMVVGGSFTSVAGVSHKSIFAFDPSTNAVSTTFAPTLDGEVDALYAGPIAGTVYAAGTFQNVDGTAQRGITLLNLGDGSRVTTFKATVAGGSVSTLKLVGSKLYVGGSFTGVSGYKRGGLASLNPTTGVPSAFLNSTVAVNHNWTAGSSVPKGAVGVEDLDVTPDGSKMVVIGNFKQVDGLARDQIAVLDLTGSTAVVQSNWASNAYTAACYNWAYDSYVRDVDISPDGRWFAVGATGGSNTPHCDSVARFELGATGTDVEPTWTDYAGGDSVYSVAVVGNVVYEGGHMRWMNNQNGNDFAGAGAVPRPGLAAVDARTGEPIAWNPGRNPRGAGAWTLYATSNGLWVGSDTDYIGNFQYKRPKLAFFPLAGGSALASDSAKSLPGTVYEGTTAASSNVLYRVDAGGPAIPATDGGPDWAADQSDPSPYRNTGSNPSGYSSGATTDSTVPSTTPNAVFDSERWYPDDSGQWSFPVPAGTQVDVRLYFANRYTGTSSVGSRVFTVSLDGQTMLDHFDIVAAAGDQTGTMRDAVVTSPGTITIGFTHVTENPLVNGIEIVKTGSSTTTGDSFVRRSFTGASAGSPVATTNPLTTGSVRGSVLIGNTLFYGGSDGNFFSRTFNGRTFGPETAIDPYNDPVWSNVDTGSGQTYRGARPSFYSEIPTISSMFYDSGFLYYTLSGDANLYYRGFSPDSGVIAPNRSTVSGVSLPPVSGAFLAGGKLFYAAASSGTLYSVPFTSGAVGLPGTLGTTATAVSGPSNGGIDWRGRVLFYGPADQAPTAAATASCDGLTCSFSAAGSSDPDGSITSYAWDLGDGSTGTGVTLSHTYGQAGSVSAKLTVTDDDGATSTATVTVHPATASGAVVGYRAGASVQSSVAAPSITVPATVQSGDELLLFATSGSATSATAPSGWTQVAQKASSTVLTTIWQKTATAADAGVGVPVTFSAAAKEDLKLVAYSGAGPVSSAVSATATSASTHVSPAAAVATAGSWVVRYWADKGTTTTAWTTPSSVTVRQSSAGGSGTFVSAALGDAGPVASGSAATSTATTPGATRDITATVVIPPAS